MDTTVAQSSVWMRCGCAIALVLGEIEGGYLCAFTHILSPYLSLSINADIPLNSMSKPPINIASANPPVIKSIKFIVVDFEF
jgi:hypothetical protein